MSITGRNGSTEGFRALGTISNLRHGAAWEGGQDRVVRGSLDRIGEECYLRIIFHSLTSFFTPSEDNLYFLFLLPLSPSMFFLQWQCYKIMTHFKVNIPDSSPERKCVQDYYYLRTLLRGSSGGRACAW